MDDIKISPPCLIEQSRLELLVSQGPAVIYACKSDGDYPATYISQNVQDQLGYEPSDFLNDPLFWASHIHLEDREAVFTGLPKLFENGRHTHLYRFLHKNGEYLWMRDELRLILSEDGNPVEIIGSWTDLTSTVEQEQSLIEARAHLAEAQKIASLGSWNWDISSGSDLWSDEVFNIFNVSPETFIPTHDFFLSRIHPDDRQRVELAVEQAFTKKTPYRIEHRIVLLDGEVRHVLAQGKVKVDDSGEAIRMTGTILDITDRKQTELALMEKTERLKHFAHYDPLTNLPNRIFFEDRMIQALSRAKRKKHLVAVFLIDIDNFKKANDTYGHHVGDLLLKDIAKRLKGTIRETDTLARFSGDEFVIFIEEPAAVDKVAFFAQKLLNALDQPFTVQSQKFYLTASIGISIYPDNADTVENLLKCADMSMYAAKHKRNAYQFYSSEMDARAHELLLLENDLRQAIVNKELVLYYQPQIDLSTGQLFGMEALLRWQHPERGLVPPDEFIPFAEDSGLIVPIGTWVLQTACKQARTFLEAGIPPFRMCVNISMQQFKKPDFPELVLRTLEETGFAAEFLELEVTESIAMENAEETISHLSRLRQKGVRVAIDDFGTGYSSLSHLKHLPIDTLKIDKEFVAEVMTDPYDFSIVEAILSLASSLNLDVVAEGIETKEQNQTLSRLGCQIGQGYFFCRPLPIDELIPLCNVGVATSWGAGFRDVQLSLISSAAADKKKGSD
jgi:diguanylate cyclase (GGDEF)-like protein/PAS domain S-box-containing protein